MKVKSKISYLGKKINILPRKMTKKLAVEVHVKNTDKGVGGVVHLIYCVKIKESGCPGFYFPVLRGCTRARLS